MEDEENEEAAATEGAAVGRGSSCRASRGGSGSDGVWASGEKNEEAMERNEPHSLHHSNQQSGNGKSLTPTGLITSLAAGLLVGSSSCEKDSSGSHTHSVQSAQSQSQSASAAEHQEVQENGEKSGCRGSNELFLQSSEREVENSELGRLLGSGPLAPLASPGEETTASTTTHSSDRTRGSTRENGRQCASAQCRSRSDH